MTESSTPTLSNEQLSEVLRLIKGADSVELKLSVPDADQRSAVAALDMDPLDAQIRQVVFFDTPDLPLERARRRGARPPGPGPSRRYGGEAAPGRSRRRSRRSCARLPASASRSTPCPVASSAPASMKAHARPRPVSSETFAGSASARKLLHQGAAARSSPTMLQRGSRSTTSSMLGPINVLKLKFTPGELRPPDGGRAVALPRRHAPARAVDEVPAGRRPSRWRPRPKAFLAGHGHRPRAGRSRPRRARRSTTSPASSQPPPHDADGGGGGRVPVDERTGAVPSDLEYELMTTTVTTPAADDQAVLLAQPAERRGVPAPRRRPRRRAERRRGRRAPGSGTARTSSPRRPRSRRGRRSCASTAT